MTGTQGKTFVGFGFGPIQSGLFLFEAYRSGNFSRFVVAEVDDALVSAVRAGSGRYSVNVASRDEIEAVELEGIELYSPSDSADRAALVAAVAEADEMATALPSVAFYDVGGSAAVAGILADGIGARDEALPTILYAAENHNRAAEHLAEAVGRYCPDLAGRRVEALNTVIGKMSGVITDAATIGRMKLATLTPGIPRAVLVEQFNRILISRVTLGGFRRGIDVFIEKDDLLPFEEAKLYGHNAVHALIGYLAQLRSYRTIAEAGEDGEIMAAARRAFLDESGAALVRRHAAVGDELFTPAGYRRYAEDLLERMVCPNLDDLVSRVCRDPVRKLGYEDRLYGTMALALRYGVEPVELAVGAAAAVVSLIRGGERPEGMRLPVPPAVDEMDEQSLGGLLRGIWADKADERAGRLIELTLAGLGELRRRGYPG